MEQIKTSMDKNGRVLIPAQFRKELDMKPGNNYLVSLYEDEIKIITLDKAIDEMHAIFTKNKNANNSVEEFLSDRRKEYEIEKARGQ